MRKSAFTLCLFIFMLAVAAGCSDGGEESEEDKAVNGKWTGAIDVPNHQLEIIVNLIKEDGRSGTISIPVQGIKDYPLSSVTVNGQDIAFFMEVHGQQISFDGEYKDDVIEGNFSQQGQTFPFRLTKGGLVDESDENFLSVETNEGTLYGELEKPDGDGPFPVMLIIPGSGLTDRNGNSSGIQGENNSLKMLAERLAEQGIASVRYDKRGTGKNLEAAIPENELRFSQFVNDAVKWTELLEQEENFASVGIIGHSQGSLVGMLAAKERHADIFVSLAGSGRLIDQVLLEQLENQLSGDSLQEAESIIKKLKQGEEVQDVNQELQSVFRPSVQSFIASWMQYDPVKEMGELEVPTLIVGGGRDLQVSASDAELLYEAQPNTDKLIIEKMNHVLKEAPEDEQGNKETYSNPDLPLADGLMEAIMGFLRDRDFWNKWRF